MKTLKGIDISEMQGRIDYSKVKKQVGFIIFRLGFGGDYTNQDDSQVQYNFTNCEKLGIPYGVYLYSYANTIEKAKSESAHALRLLKGHKPTYPVFLDLEESRIANCGKAKILEIAKTFCNAIEKAGYKYGTYANLNWFENYLTDPWYNTKPIWIAQYYSKCEYNKHYDIWQYSSTGRVNGISGNVDMNYMYVKEDLLGDVDGDGRITAKDARLALRASANLVKLTAEQKKRADIDGDGKRPASSIAFGDTQSADFLPGDIDADRKITAKDARAILRISAGMK